MCSPYNLDQSDLPASPEEEEGINAGDIPWEERYEKIWVEKEKKETKSHYKNVTAELKERFGELEHKEPADVLEDGEDGKQDVGDEEVDVPEEKEADSSEEEDEPIVRPTARARSAVLLPIPEQRESGMEDSQSEEPPEIIQRTVSVEISDADLFKDQHHPPIIQDNKVDSSEDEDDGDLSAGSGTKANAKTESDINLDEKEEERHRTLLLAASEPDVPTKILDVPSSDSDEVEEGLWKSRYEVGHQRDETPVVCSSLLKGQTRLVLLTSR